MWSLWQAGTTGCLEAKGLLEKHTGMGIVLFMHFVAFKMYRTISAFIVLL